MQSPILGWQSQLQFVTKGPIVALCVLMEKGNNET